MKLELFVYFHLFGSMQNEAEDQYNITSVDSCDNGDCCSRSDFQDTSQSRLLLLHR